MEQPELRAGVNRLVESHLGYAHAIAAEVLKKLPSSVNRADVERSAEFGLLQAASAYDPSKSAVFTTFAYYRIRGAIYDDLRHVSRVSKFSEAGNAYIIDHSFVSAPADSREAEYAELRQVTSHIVTSYLLSRNSVYEKPASSSVESPLHQVLRKERQKQLQEALRRLPKMNRKVINSYYFRGLSFADIGRELGFSEASAWRLHAKSLEMIRAALEEKATKRSDRGLLAGEAAGRKKPASFQDAVR